MMSDDDARKIQLGEESFDNFLAHYASRYYDPQKAHAYYEQHKHLKDKQKLTALTSAKQREVYAVEQENIRKAKAREVKTLTTKTKTDVKQLRKTAQKTVDEISSSLKALAQQLKNTAAEPTLNVIPKDATPQQRAFLEKQNEILKQKARKAANDKYSHAAGQSARDRARVTGALSSAVNDAGNKYSLSMANLNKKYATISSREKRKIHNSIEGQASIDRTKKAQAAAKAAAHKRTRHKKAKK